MLNDNSKIVKKTKGYYTKQLASMNNTDPIFIRSNNKHIKKDNKISCKEARLKKKQYLTQLQKQNTILKTQNGKLIKQVNQLKCKLSQTSIGKKINQQKDDKSNRLELLMNEFKELMISLHKKNQISIRRSLSVLRDLFGISGRERKKWIKQSIERAVELSMPMHFRLLLQNCQDSFKFFQLLGGTRDMRSQNIHFGQKEQSILKMVRPKIKLAKDTFNKIFSKIHSNWSELQQYSHQTQKIIDQIEEGLDPVFVGNLLVSLDKERGGNPDLRNIYPINYFKTIPEDKMVPMLQLPQIPAVYDEQDNYPFSLQFGDYI